jgi:hypothetical protein
MVQSCKLLALACSLFLVGHAGGFPAPPAAVQPPAAAAPVPAYRPYQDQTIHFGEHAAALVGETLFGWYRPDARWNLKLDGPVDADGFATGTNDVGQTFTLDATVLLEAPVDVPGYEPGACTRGAWSGAISTPAGALVAWGLIYSAPDLGITIIPLIIERDQDRAWERHVWRVQHGRNIAPRDAQCALDEVGEFQLRQNQINARACIRSAQRQFVGTVVLCTTVGGISCWFTFGAGCVGGLVCDLAACIAAMLWQAEYENEWDRSEQCLCLESAWRTEHPTSPLPNASCGGFRCPPFLLNPVKLF